MLYFARWKLALIAAALLAAVVIALPNLFPSGAVERWPDWMPKRQMVLGLDLRGGAHMLLQVDRDDLVRERVETLLGDVRQTLRDQRIGYRNLRAEGGAIAFDLREAADADKALAALQPLTEPIQA